HTFRQPQCARGRHARKPAPAGRGRHKGLPRRDHPGARSRRAQEARYYGDLHRGNEARGRRRLARGASRVTATGPLSAIRVIEVCHMLAGPYCGMLLADLGAEVIKVETGDGDISRSTGGHVIDGENLYFNSLNRNKKSVLLDITRSGDREAFESLIETSDVLITNLRPRAIRKLGLTYDQLRKVNPRLVCVAITGFGLTGPYSDL